MGLVLLFQRQWSMLLLNSTAHVNQLALILQVLIELNKHSINSSSLVEYISVVHQLLAKLMDVNSLCLALHNSKTNSIQFVYPADETEGETKTEIDGGSDPEMEVSLTDELQSPVAWVIINKQQLVLTAGEESNYKFRGAPLTGEHWLGLPLMAHQGDCIGVLVVKSYTPNVVYTEEEQNILTLFASVVASYIEKHTKEQVLETIISTRTAALAKELLDKKKSENLQHAIFEIASLSNEKIALPDLYHCVHLIVEKLLYARNFSILIFDEETSEISFSYFADEKDEKKLSGKTFQLGNDFYSYVINQRKPLLLTPVIAKELVNKGELMNEQVADDFSCWLGAPMISSNVLHGIIVVQSYDVEHIYSDKDLDILSFVASHVASAIEVKINTQNRGEAQLNLAKNHRLLEQQNVQLSTALKQVKSTQKQLIQKQKMASLGGLVAGIAHEINTPLGICVTGVSHLVEEAKIFRELIESDNLSETQLFSFLDDLDEINSILINNTRRAADLIYSFKQIAVDQSSGEIRHFKVKQYLDEIVLSLKPTLRQCKHVISILCDESLTVNTNAGAIAQIVSNMVLNSIRHAFDDIEQGEMEIRVIEKKGTIVFQYKDNGKGIDEKNLAKLFDPFFTTKRGEGGSGLGTHLIFNLVTSSLQGKITARSEVGKGLAYIINFPAIINEG